MSKLHDAVGPIIEGNVLPDPRNGVVTWHDYRNLVGFMCEVTLGVMETERLTRNVTDYMFERDLCAKTMLILLTSSLNSVKGGGRYVYNYTNILDNATSLKTTQTLADIACRPIHGYTFRSFVTALLSVHGGHNRQWIDCFYKWQTLDKGTSRFPNRWEVPTTLIETFECYWRAGEYDEAINILLDDSYINAAREVEAANTPPKPARATKTKPARRR